MSTRRGNYTLGYDVAVGYQGPNMTRISEKDGAIDYVFPFFIMLSVFSAVEALKSKSSMVAVKVASFPWYSM